MTLSVHTLERNAPLLLMVGFIAGLALAICAALDPATSARAVLFSWLYWIGIAAGAMVLLAAHALSGGVWGDAARPILQTASRALFVTAFPFIVVVLTSGDIYPWATNAAGSSGNEVTRFYLEPAAFAFRGAAILVIWSTFGIVLARSTHLGSAWASAALVIYMPTITIAAVDWSASLLPYWSSRTYGVLVGAAQVTSALAFTALLRSDAPADGATGDIAGLVLAAVLGTAYLGFMQLLVIWSSGLPERTAWYELRLKSDGIGLIVGAFLIGAVIPFFVLIMAKVRSNAALTGSAGLLVLSGLALFWAWQIIPDNPWPALLIYPLAFLAIGAIWLGIAFGPLAHSEARPDTGVSSRG